jgi:pyrimidine deaminase RibD-like protein
LKEHPADWAKTHIRILIDENKHMVTLWIKSVCDKQDFSKPHMTDQEREDFVFWKNWRAPKLIHMRPSGNLPYDPSAAWDREGEPMTNELLDGLSGRVILSLSFDLDGLAGDAHVELAKAGGSVGAATIREAGFWGSIHAEFKALAHEERAYAPGNAGDRWLVAHVSYNDPDATYGDWTVYRGINEEFKARFEALATRAGKALEPTMPSKPLHVWLHRLFLDLVEHDSEFLLAAKKGVGGIIKNICAASSTYSARLDMNALEKSDGSGVQDHGHQFEQMAIEEALKSVPEDDRPHPKVGAIVVKNGRVLSKAHRGESPKCHAEYIALEQKLSDDLVAGATVYTTLEPCTTRKHPKIPCAQRLVDRKVARVVIGMLDPNPEIRGLGEQLLNEAGIEIQLFPRELRAQVEDMNREFIRAQKQKSPRSIGNVSLDNAATTAARALIEGTWDLQKAAWSFYGLHTRYRIAQPVGDTADEERHIVEKIDFAFKVFSQDYDLPPDLSAVAKDEIGRINIALLNLKAFSMTVQEPDFNISATQIQNACERIRVAAKPYAYRSPA